MRADIEDEARNLHPDEKKSLILQIFASLDPENQSELLKTLKIPAYQKKCSDFHNLYSWRQMADDDLAVARMDNVPAFIRCFHAQQALEKMLKAALVVTAGTFQGISKKLLAEREKHPKRHQTFADAKCAWEIDINFPITHDLVKLWKMLHKLDSQNFVVLTEEQRQLFAEIAKYAAYYRYPHFSSAAGDHVSFVPVENVPKIVQVAEVLCDRLFSHIVSQTS